jgi:hypothetical protein
MSQREPNKNNRLALTKSPACGILLKSYESNKKISDHEVVPSFYATPPSTFELAVFLL